jgi:hypothetical protein
VGTYSYSGKIVDVTVQKTGNYDITAYGAQGGAEIFYGGGYAGGYGAKISGEFHLTVGEKLEILVGGEGSGAAHYGGGGGGGGSFVVETNTRSASVEIPLVIAGGGGGNGFGAGSRRTVSGATLHSTQSAYGWYRKDWLTAARRWLCRRMVRSRFHFESAVKAMVGSCSARAR